MFLGKYVVDRASGLKGYATQRIEKFNGSIQFSIQPFAEDGASYMDAFWVDEAFLKVYPKPDSEDLIVTNPPVLPKYAIGVKIKDAVSEKEGYIVSIVTHVNGCTFYLVENKDGEFYVPTTRAKYINEGISVPAFKEKAPGGPTTKAVRL